jgi:hypothetical protein
MPGGQPDIHCAPAVLSCRLAMLGFVGMILTEAITGVNILQAWGLQDVYFGIRSPTGL